MVVTFRQPRKTERPVPAWYMSRRGGKAIIVLDSSTVLGRLYTPFLLPILCEIGRGSGVVVLLQRIVRGKELSRHAGILVHDLAGNKRHLEDILDRDMIVYFCPPVTVVR